MIVMHGSEPGNLPSQQRGFTLVELMVSLLVGLLIILGATQLFMISRQSFEQVKDFGIRQGALNFSVDMLSRDIRRASSVSLGGESQDGKSKLRVIVANKACVNQEETREYYLDRTSSREEVYSLYMKAVCIAKEETSNGNGIERPEDVHTLVRGFSEGGLEIAPISLLDGNILPHGEISGLWRITLDLMPVSESDGPNQVTFQVMNRMRALNPSADEPKPGYDSEGNKLYPNACYRGGIYDPDKPGCSRNE